MAAKNDEPSDGELEAQLIKLSRSKQSGTRLQAQVAATRAVLHSRHREREALDRAEREREREQRAASAEAEADKLPDDVRESWFGLDVLHDMASAARWHLPPEEWRAGSPRTRWLEQEAKQISWPAELHEWSACAGWARR